MHSASANTPFLFCPQSRRDTTDIKYILQKEIRSLYGLTVADHCLQLFQEIERPFSAGIGAGGAEITPIADLNDEDPLSSRSGRF